MEMIYRKIFKTKVRITKEGREPLVSPPKGINMLVLEYKDNYAIVEFWCSDHPLLEPEDRKDVKDLINLKSNPAIIEEVKSHPKSPKIIGGIYMSGSSSPDSVNEKTKTITYKGRSGKYIEKRKHKIHTRNEIGQPIGIEEDLYVLDEG